MRVGKLEFLEYKDIEEPGYAGKQYYVDGPLDVDSVIQLIASCENEKAVLYECRCSTFTEEGSTRRHRFTKVDQLQELHDFPNPSIHVHAIYVDPNTIEYRFDLSTAVNTRIVEFSVDDRVNAYVKSNMEQDRMERKAAQKRKREGR